MRGTVAKRLRREIYGDLSYREGRYAVRTGRDSRGRRLLVGGIQADERRRAYQHAKRRHGGRP
jgi:hypothetical protein